jgi:hypothetical protein
MLELLKANNTEVTKLYNSFKERRIMKLQRNFNIEKIRVEDETRLIYRIISTELWLRNL